MQEIVGKNYEERDLEDGILGRAKALNFYFDEFDFFESAINRLRLGDPRTLSMFYGLEELELSFEQHKLPAMTNGYFKPHIPAYVKYAKFLKSKNL